MRSNKYLIFLFLPLTILGCGNEKAGKPFILLNSRATGITFSNLLMEDEILNGITFEHMYDGSGIGIGDFNNDGLQDIFFAGNMVSSELYLNLGNLTFKNITNLAGVGTNKWCHGVSVIDINQDGLKDIYISVGGFSDINSAQGNIFFINQGIDENGIPHFIDMAREMNLDDNGNSIMGAFFDYDRDGDLDLYLLTNALDGLMRYMLRPIRSDGSGKSTDRLYRNEGNNSFTNVSKEAGIVYEGYGLGVGLLDINQDGWTDIYCSDDFISNDLLYLNNQDGTFSEQSSEHFKNFTHNGMGMDIADINNDALLDVLVLDMLPADNKRKKLMLASNAFEFHDFIEMGYHPQFLRNTLQLNRGRFSDGKYHFSEIGFFSGIAETDWSWAPIIADLDNDGYKDILVSNGFRKDVTNLDYIEKINDMLRFGRIENPKELILNEVNKLPEVMLPNYIFQNLGNLKFEDRSKEWGIIHPTFSNGAAMADFDNDGDLDLVFNNIDQEVTFYENRFIQDTNKNERNHYLNIRFAPEVSEVQKPGLKVWLYQNNNQQYVEYYPFRGYKSTQEELIHFGIGQNVSIDSLIIQWNDGYIEKFAQLTPDTVINLTRHSVDCPSYNSQPVSKLIERNHVVFQEITKKINLNLKHSSIVGADMRITVSLLHSLSNYGPSLSVGDINGDGLEDIFHGGDAGDPAITYLQHKNQGYTQGLVFQDSIYHDTGSLLFDADNDGDLDLYMVSGGYRWPMHHSYYQDRLYYNDGKGNFIPGKEALPEITASGSCVLAADYDKDGDLDLFVGGRAEGRNYPQIPQSYLLQNEGGRFLDRSDLLGQEYGRLGMVTAALWSDVNNDLIPDLIMVGEWMPVTILLNLNGRFINKTSEYGLINSTGWWNSINGADFDNDGDIDYVLGNYGLNSFYKASSNYPLELHAKDFDLNGTIDPIITNYINDKKYIVHSLTTLSDLIPGIRNRIKTHSAYGATTFDEIFPAKELNNSTTFNAKILCSSILENVDGRTFRFHDLPPDVQFSPVFGSAIRDVDHDGLQDIILVGNSRDELTTTGYYEGSFGNVLINQDNYKWQSLDPSISNFIADGNQRAIVQSVLANGDIIFIISENNGILKSYALQNTNKKKIYVSGPKDWFITYELNGRKVKAELYYGQGFLSASTRTIEIPEDAGQIEVYQFDGNKKSITSGGD